MKSGAWLPLLVACATLGACSVLPWRGESAQQRTLVVAVLGLGQDDPILQSVPDQTARAEDVLATGMGATALFELLDGRPALQQLQHPADPLHWARQAYDPVRLDALDAGIISDPEWTRAGLVARTESAPESGQLAAWHVIVTGRDQIDAETMRAWLDLADHNTLVLIVGIPRAPRRDLRHAPGGAADEIWNKLHVPVLVRGRDIELLRLEGRQTLGSVLSAFRGQELVDQQLRIAHWWNHYGGGVLVDDTGAVAVGGSDRDAVWIDGATARGSADSLISSVAPSGDLLIMVRGSSDADLTSLELLTGTRPQWSPWGLESIDRVDHPSPRCLRIDLAAEPEGDGILLHDWTAQFVDIRVAVTLEEAPLVGTPVRDAGSGRWLGINSLALHPWSRDWWSLTRKLEFDVEDWWAQSAAGIDLLWIGTADALPEPVELDL